MHPMVGGWEDISDGAISQLSALSATLNYSYLHIQ